MLKDNQVLYTATATVTGGRQGSARSGSGRLAVELSRPTDASGSGTNPEELFAAGYAACFDSALAVAAQRLGVQAGDTRTEAEVDLVNCPGGSYALQVRLTVDARSSDRSEMERVVELADKLCPYSNAVRGNVPVSLVIRSDA